MTFAKDDLVKTRHGRTGTYVGPHANPDFAIVWMDKALGPGDIGPSECPRIVAYVNLQLQHPTLEDLLS